MRPRQRRETFIAVVAAIILSTLGLVKIASNFELESLEKYAKKKMVEQSAETYRIYKDNFPTLEKKVRRNGIYQRKQMLEGVMLDRSGVVSNVTSEIISELVFSFSPTAEKHFAKKLVDPNHEQRVYGNSPAMIWDGEKFIVVMRMWLDKEHTEGRTKNIFSDNYLYARSYNDKMEALDISGRVLGIPTRVIQSVGDGPIEPRAFPFYEQIYLSFNAALYVGKKEVDTTMFWDWRGDRFVMPKVTDGQPQFKTRMSMPRDKHWSPYEFDNKLYMVYSFDPLRIISCDKGAVCHFTQNAADSDYRFNDLQDSVRGGTPTLWYRENFYITITHSTHFRPGYKRYYTFNLLVLKVDKKSPHKVIYFSEPINLHEELMTKTPIIRTKWIVDPFFFPVSLLKEDEDNIIIGGHINDHSAYLFRVKGIKKLMEEVIHKSELLDDEGPANKVLHRLSQQFATAQSGYVFRT
ncbi:uncharacterized protein [Watersipora subatra]|uniref:uncharacterized protein n=1 Tax=Watersipora subatra TaxID=2589382 RepID=UPI00355C1A8E